MKAANAVMKVATLRVQVEGGSICIEAGAECQQKKTFPSAAECVRCDERTRACVVNIIAKCLLYLYVCSEVPGSRLIVREHINQNRRHLQERGL